MDLHVYTSLCVVLVIILFKFLFEFGWVGLLFWTKSLEKNIFFTLSLIEEEEKRILQELRSLQGLNLFNPKFTRLMHLRVYFIDGFPKYIFSRLLRAGAKLNKMPGTHILCRFCTVYSMAKCLLNTLLQYLCKISPLAKNLNMT